MISYITALVAVVLLGGVSACLIKNAQIQRIIKLLSGLLLIIVLLKPLAAVDVSDIGDQLIGLVDREFTTEDYQAMYQSRLREHIQSTSEEFIRKKGESLGCTISVKVELSQDEYPVPVSVQVKGSMDYNQVLELKRYITEEIGIGEDKQRWQIIE